MRPGASTACCWSASQPRAERPPLARRLRRPAGSTSAPREAVLAACGLVRHAGRRRASAAAARYRAGARAGAATVVGLDADYVDVRAVQERRGARPPAARRRADRRLGGRAGGRRRPGQRPSSTSSPRWSRRTRRPAGTNHVHYVAATSMAGAGPVRARAVAQRPAARGRVGGRLRAEHDVGTGLPGAAAATVTVDAEPDAALPGPARRGRRQALAAIRACCGRARCQSTCSPPRTWCSDAGFTTVDDLVHGLGGGYLPPVLGHRGAHRAAATPHRCRRG